MKYLQEKGLGGAYWAAGPWWGKTSWLLNQSMEKKDHK